MKERFEKKFNNVYLFFNEREFVVCNLKFFWLIIFVLSLIEMLSFVEEVENVKKIYGGINRKKDGWILVKKWWE